MSSKTPNMRAILSVSDKTGLLDFGRGLVAHGVELVSTGGTSKAIAEAGLPVTNVSDVTGFPEMMDGRVKTLHPKIHGGILARRHRPDDLEAIKSPGGRARRSRRRQPVSVREAAQNPETPFDELVEQIDIGGPSAARRGQELPRRDGRRRSGGLPEGPRADGAPPAVRRSSSSSA